MRVDVVLLSLLIAAPAMAQVAYTPAEGVALWQSRSAPIMDAVTLLETGRACKLVDDGTADQAIRVLGEAASKLYAFELHAPVPQSKWIGDFHAAEARGRADATPHDCLAYRTNALASASMKDWAARIAFGGR
jgi:hypothetical protein